MDPGAQVTMMLREMRDGREGARERLAGVVYGELRKLAGAMMVDERAAHTLQPTALVHEAYVRLASGPGVDAQDRNHFMAIAAKVMRQVLLDHARARRANKRGGGRVYVAGEGIDGGQSASAADNRRELDDGLDVLDLDDALHGLATLYPRAARVVELRFFGGLSVADAAAVLGTAEPTVERDWALARGWLKRKLGETSGDRQGES